MVETFFFKRSPVIASPIGLVKIFEGFGARYSGADGQTAGRRQARVRRRRIEMICVALLMAVFIRLLGMRSSRIWWPWLFLGKNTLGGA
ncbi:MAG: hypothetical protein ACRBBV_09995 [Paracoccaceae bacterium]